MTLNKKVCSKTFGSPPSAIRTFLSNKIYEVPDH